MNKKIKVITPEALLGMKEPKECWHYGHCDRCHDPDYPLVFHFGYNKQAEPYGGSFRICRKCLVKLKKTLYPKWEKLSQKDYEARVNKILGKVKKK